MSASLLLGSVANAQQHFGLGYGVPPCLEQLYGPRWDESRWPYRQEGPLANDMMGYHYGRHITSPHMVRVIDENQDGLISEDEAAAWHEEAFLQMDSNEDHILTLEEFMSARLGPGAYRTLTPEQETNRFLRKQRRFQAMAPDADGKTSKADFMASGKERYKASDLDGDGQVTVWEFRAHRRKI